LPPRPLYPSRASALGLGFQKGTSWRVSFALIIFPCRRIFTTFSTLQYADKSRTSFSENLYSSFSSVRRRTKRCATTTFKVEEIKKGSAPISSSRGRLPAALVV